MKKEIIKFYNEINDINYYISRSKTIEIKLKYQVLYNKIKKNIIYKIIFYKFYKYYKNIYKNIDIKNNETINLYLKEKNSLLNDINGYMLDEEQKRAVYTLEDNTLLVSGAGAGKSLTIIGKIRYLIEEKNIKEEEILCISFTNDSCNSLKNNLNKKYNYNVDVFTFHKLALNILKNNDEIFSIVSSDYLEYIVDEIFQSTLLYVKSDKKIYYYLKNNILTFIKLFKSNGYTKENFYNFFKENEKEKNKYIKKENEILLKIILNFYIIYQDELNSSNKIDFDDMIIMAEKSVRENGIYKNYKYIIIDEYQDTSYIRYKLINAIKECSDSKIFAVGDDFQSIYRFSGCDLNIFLKFEKYFGYSKILYLNNTYRNSKELIKVSSEFIMKNHKQLRKNLKSIKTCYKPIKICFYNNEKIDIKDLIKYIYNNYNSKIYILGRNNFDINKLLDEKLILNDNKIILKEYEEIKIKYFTVHKSKGLEEENVILINVNDEKIGFPSKIQNDNIIKFVLKEDENYSYAEERRLFYVALTRTKNNVYIFCKKNKESIFVKELMSNYKNYIEILNYK